MNFFDADVYNFSLDAFNGGLRSTVMRNAPPGFSYPGDPTFEGESGVKPTSMNGIRASGSPGMSPAMVARRCAPAWAWGTITSTTRST